jgi:hypothetical protein
MVRKIFRIEEVDSNQRPPNNLNKDSRASDGGYDHGNTVERLNATTAFSAMSRTMGEGILIVPTTDH